MRVRSTWFLLASLALFGFEGTASACLTCHKTPCVLAPVAAPAPAYQCVTEMVPQTVYKPIKRVEYETVTETIMVKKADYNYVYRQRLVRKPVWDTHTIEREVSFCRPVSQTTMVDQQYTVCRPVSTTRQVTEYCMQPSTTLVTVPVAAKCGLCGKPKPACGCQTVAQTSYTPVPVVKDVVETHMVAETLTRQVPVTTTHMVRETKVETVPIRTCRVVEEWITEKIPVTTYHCEPKTVTRQIPHTVCEMVAVTTYHPVQKMVPVIYAPAPTPVPSTQATPAASTQASLPDSGHIGD